MVDSSSRMGLGENATQSFFYGFPFLLDRDGVGNNHMFFVGRGDRMAYRERQEFRIKSPPHPVRPPGLLIFRPPRPLRFP